MCCFMIIGDPGTSPMSPLYNESESEYCKTCGTFCTYLDSDNNCPKCEHVVCTLCGDTFKASDTKRFLCRSVCKECIEYSTDVENVSVRVKVLEQIEKEIDLRKKCINALETIKKAHSR